MATTRICPKCKQEIPTAIDDLSDLSIAIIGAKEAGKSHYVAMLIHWIKRMGKEFGWNLTALTEETLRRYNSEFHNPLFKDFKSIEITQAVRGKGAASPLIYSLRLDKGLFSKRIMLVFFDAAGENLEQTDALWYINRYIYNASGIICLLDPLQLSRVRQGILRTHSEDTLPSLNTETGVIINRVENLIRKNTNIGSAKIKIPLAVAFSKMDYVRDASANAAAVSDRLFEATQHNGVFNEAEFTDIDGLMRSWVDEVDDTADIIPQSENFERTGFFGFSALGCNPKGNHNVLEHAPRSFRVEDPFLWILKNYGLIKTTKG
ncbi:MAG: hypothetical protein IJS08_02935 [Victivallales bacterium]|nr:hypothetical protein [Victivallales bacterium]